MFGSLWFNLKVPLCQNGLPSLPSLMMQLYKDYPSSLSACFSFSLCPHSCISLLCHHFPLINMNFSLLIFSVQSLLILLILLLVFHHFPRLFHFPSLSLSLSLSLSGMFQVVTRAATVAVQSPASPTWPAPFCWWISSSTSRGGGRGRRGSVQS